MTHSIDTKTPDQIKAALTFAEARNLAGAYTIAGLMLLRVSVPDLMRRLKAERADAIAAGDDVRAGRCDDVALVAYAIDTVSRSLTDKSMDPDHVEAAHVLLDICEHAAGMIRKAKANKPH